MGIVDSKELMFKNNWCGDCEKEADTISLKIGENIIEICPSCAKKLVDILNSALSKRQTGF